ncbi:MAG: Xaa-Pro dipeptidase, partial [Candidatus Aureabacteria bacterium]|nr:Xaa-Pro dipeptidase [Candidatus Auribacterota bacterium]
FHGLSGNSFPVIVASGTSSSILHYSKNRNLIKKGGLVLVDAGGEYEGYASDITRTFPVNKRFSNRQRQIYAIVLQANEQCIQMIRPGISLKELQDEAVHVIIDGLIKMNILKGDPEKIKSKKTHALFFPHGVSHSLGLDVHDVFVREKKRKNPPCLRADFILKEGHVITVEPGIYFIQPLLTDKKLRKKHAELVNWKKALNFLDFGGIRIEDDVLVTKNSRRVLTRVPKTISEIESLRSR